MTPFNHQDCGVAAAVEMTFDELFPGDSRSRGKAATKYASRLISAPYDEQRADVTAASASPVTPSSSEEAPNMTAPHCITGKFVDIERMYRIDPRVLGTGHHGSVRLCTERATGRRRAVKSVRKGDRAVKPEAVAREIALLRDIDHPNVITLVDVFEDADHLHLVTDLCEGGELYDKISERSSGGHEGAPCFSEEEAAGILRQILVAVSWMHAHGIVHRDIKPENVLFETSDEGSPVKIIDFGLSRYHLPSRGEPPMSAVVGTPYYIAPEVLRRRYDGSCDLWSVGVVAYVLLCGYPPFNGANNRMIHDAVLRGRYHFPSGEWSRTSVGARDFVRRLLQTDPRRRMTAAQALCHPWMEKHVKRDAEALDEDRASPSAEVSAKESTPRIDSEVSRRPRRRRSGRSIFRLYRNQR